MLRLILKDGCKIAFQSRKTAFQRFSTNAKPRQAGFGKVLLILTPVAAVGGGVYGYFDKDYRKLIGKNLTELRASLKLDEENVLDKILLSVINLYAGNQTETLKQFEPKKPIKVNSDAVRPKPSTDKAPVVVSTPPKSQKPSSASADVVGLEQEIELAASLTLQELNKAINVLNSFNADVRKILENDADTDSWTGLKNKRSIRDSAIKRAEESANQTINKIKSCEENLNKIENSSNLDHVLKIRNKINTATEHIKKTKNDLYKLKTSSFLSENYWGKVEAARNYFLDQVESIFPGTNLEKKEFKINPDDMDLFLLHAYSHVLAYQKELLLLQTDGELRLKRAIEACRGNDQSIALDALLENEKRKLAIENKNKIINIRTNLEKQLRNQLKLQLDAHVDHLKESIALKEEEIRRNLDRELENKLSTEKTSLKLQLAAILGKLRGINASLTARSESDRSAHEAQALWTLCQSLWTILGTKNSNEKFLKSELNDLYNIFREDELVSIVIKNLPETVKKEGVQLEHALCERFANVESTCRKVALVPEQGARLPIYLLSYLQSIFMISQRDQISSDEIENKSIDFRKLDTFDILDRARYYVMHGDLLQALKYMNLLQDAPRKVASDWINETRLFLETQQAANTLMNYAAASGLIYL